MTRRNHKKNNNDKITDFGERTINKQNFSRTVVLPKTALKNCGNDEVQEMNVQLVQNRKEKYLKLTPICTTKTKKGNSHE